MRFKTFRMILIGGAAVCGVGGLLAASTCCKKEDKTEVAKPTITAAPLKPPDPIPAAKPTQTPAAIVEEGALRPMDQQLIAYLEKPATTDKVKDAFPTQSWKANIYREGSASKFNRLKIDLNRNEKWDEKWTIEDDGTIKRQVAPADDEKYTVEYRLIAGKWAKK
jgi:hypothetical protein